MVIHGFLNSREIQKTVFLKDKLCCWMTYIKVEYKRYIVQCIVVGFPWIHCAKSKLTRPDIIVCTRLVTGLRRVFGKPHQKNGHRARYATFIRSKKKNPHNRSTRFMYAEYIIILCVNRFKRFRNQNKNF